MKIIHLLKEIDYQFKNPILLKQALTHRSSNAENYERLEFLGDSLLNCIAAELIFKHFKSQTEGEMTRMRAKLVKGETLALIAKSLKLDRLIILGSGEKKSDVSTRPSILADVLEAIIAAIYLDSDFITTKKVVSKLLADRIKALDLTILKDPKSLLQEWLQGNGLELPEYTLINTEGSAHNLIFTMQATIVIADKQILEVNAKGLSKKICHQKCAEKLLKLIESKHA